MSTNNFNDADSLFATRRKKQMEEEAEKERLLELERQKKEVADEIKKLETIRAAQEEEARIKAEAEQREAAERAAAESQQSELDKRRAELAAKVSEPKAANPIDSKKLMIFGLIGLGVIALVVIIIVVVKVSSNKEEENPYQGNGEYQMESDYDYDYNDYSDEGYTSDFIKTLESSKWSQKEIIESDTFLYSLSVPAIFEKYEDSTYPYGEYFFYYDAESGQELSFEHWAYEGEVNSIKNAVESYISDYIPELQTCNSIIPKIPHDFKVECISEDYDLWCGSCGSLDELQPGETLPIFFAQPGQRGLLVVCFNITHEAQGCKRFIDISDTIVLFDAMLESLSFEQGVG